MPPARTASRTWSARSWRIPPRAAAPKMTRVLSCPVLPNGRNAIIAADRSAGSDDRVGPGGVGQFVATK